MKFTVTKEELRRVVRGLAGSSVLGLMGDKDRIAMEGEPEK